MPAPAALADEMAPPLAPDIVKGASQPPHGTMMSGTGVIPMVGPLTTPDADIITKGAPPPPLVEIPPLGVLGATPISLPAPAALTDAVAPLLAPDSALPVGGLPTSPIAGIGVGAALSPHGISCSSGAQPPVAVGFPAYPVTVPPSTGVRRRATPPPALAPRARRQPSLAVAVSPQLTQSAQAMLESEALEEIESFKRVVGHWEGWPDRSRSVQLLLLQAHADLALATGALAALKASWAEAGSSDTLMVPSTSAKSSRRRGPRRGPLPSLGVGRASKGSEASLFA